MSELMVSVPTLPINHFVHVAGSPQLGKLRYGGVLYWCFTFWVSCGVKGFWVPYILLYKGHSVGRVLFSWSAKYAGAAGYIVDA